MVSRDTESAGAPTYSATLWFDLGNLRFHLLDQRRVRSGSNDVVELPAVIAHQAHALDGHVVDQPAIPASDHPVVYGNFLLFLRQHDGAHRGHVAVDRVPD